MMTAQYIKLLDRVNRESSCLTVQDQHELAVKLAANCGYKLIGEDADTPDYFKNFIEGLKRELK